MHIKLYIKKYGAKWYLTVTDDAVRLRKESGNTELQKSLIWIPSETYKSPMNSLCASMLETCKRNYGNCCSVIYMKEHKTKFEKDYKKMMRQQLEEEQSELVQLKKTEYVKSYTRS